MENKGFHIYWYVVYHLKGVLNFNKDRRDIAKQPRQTEQEILFPDKVTNEKYSAVTR